MMAFPKRTRMLFCASVNGGLVLKLAMQTEPTATGSLEAREESGKLQT